MLHWRGIFLHALCFLALLLVSASLRAEISLEESQSAKDETRIFGATYTLQSQKVSDFMTPILEHGFNAVLVHGLDADWSATYPSKYFPFSKTRNFGPTTLKDIIDTCHAHGVKVIVYGMYIMATTDTLYIDGPPEKKAGEPASLGSMPIGTAKQAASMDSPFRDLLCGALKEIAALGADGFWLDGFSDEDNNRAGDMQAKARPIFERETGLKWPEKEDWENRDFRRWVRWRYDHHVANAKWLVDEVRKEYPRVSFSFNTHFTTPMAQEPGTPSPYAPLTWSRWREAVPIERLPLEIGVSNHARLGNSNPAQSTPFWTSLSCDLNPARSDVWQPTFSENFSIGDPNTWLNSNMNVPADEIGIKMSVLGAFTFKSIVWPEGNIHRGFGIGTEMYTRINDAVKAREKYFGGERVHYCGVFVSNNTRDFWGLRFRQDKDPRNTDRLYTESYLGLVSMLMQDHVQFRHVFDNMMDEESLDKFKVIVLPNTACLSDEACAALKGYVERGGRLIASYKTSLYNEFGDKRDDFGLGDLFGVSYRKAVDEVAMQPHTWQHTLKDASLNGGLAGFSWMARRTIVEARPETELVAVESGTSWQVSAGKGYAFETPPGKIPVITRRKLGKGEAYYIADDFSQGYYQAPYRSARRILKSLIEKSPAPFRVEAPGQVISNGFWQEEEGEKVRKWEGEKNGKNGKRLVIHLLNLPAMSTRLFERSQADSLDDLNPAQGISIELGAEVKAKSARLVPAGVDLRIEESGGKQVVKVASVAEHAMVVVELDGR